MQLADGIDKYKRVCPTSDGDLQNGEAYVPSTEQEITNGRLDNTNAVCPISEIDAEDCQGSKENNTSLKLESTAVANAHDITTNELPYANVSILELDTTEKVPSVWKDASEILNNVESSYPQIASADVTVDVEDILEQQAVSNMTAVGDIETLIDHAENQQVNGEDEVDAVCTEIINDQVLPRSSSSSPMDVDLQPPLEADGMDDITYKDVDKDAVIQDVCSEPMSVEQDTSDVIPNEGNTDAAVDITPSVNIVEAAKCSVIQDSDNLMDASESESRDADIHLNDCLSNPCDTNKDELHLAENVEDPATEHIEGLDEVDYFDKGPAAAFGKRDVSEHNVGLDEVTESNSVEHPANESDECSVFVHNEGSEKGVISDNIDGPAADPDERSLDVHSEGFEKVVISENVEVPVTERDEDPGSVTKCYEGVDELDYSDRQNCETVEELASNENGDKHFDEDLDFTVELEPEDVPDADENKQVKQPLSTGEIDLFTDELTNKAASDVLPTDISRVTEGDVQLSATEKTSCQEVNYYLVSFTISISGY